MRVIVNSVREEVHEENKGAIVAFTELDVMVSPRIIDES